jgi:hypothetical protein
LFVAVHAVVSPQGGTEYCEMAPLHYEVGALLLEKSHSAAGALGRVSQSGNEAQQISFVALVVYVTSPVFTGRILVCVPTG